MTGVPLCVMMLRFELAQRAAEEATRRLEETKLEMLEAALDNDEPYIVELDYGKQN